MEKVIGLVVAAGRGTRAGGRLPKQYQDVAGQPVLRHTLNNLLETGLLDGICVVIHPDDRDLYAKSTQNLLLLTPALGGETRAQSVQNGLAAVQSAAPDLILIHDAARPFVPKSVVEGVINALARHEGACPALPVVDALWSGGDTLNTPVSREGLWRAQTPQGFRYETICQAHATADPNAADDVAIARAAGYDVARTQGDEANFKITTPEDFRRAETYLRLK